MTKIITYSAPAFKDSNEKALSILRGLVAYARNTDRASFLMPLNAAEQILALAEIGYRDTYEEESNDNLREL